MAKAQQELDRHEDANHRFTAAAKAGYNADTCALGKVESLRALGRHKQALEQLDKLSGAVEQTAEYLYQRGATIAAIAISSLSFSRGVSNIAYPQLVQSRGSAPPTAFSTEIRSRISSNDVPTPSRRQYSCIM